MSERIALFPLRTVLFPKAVLPLRIFETRYVDMVSQCMRTGTPFGIVLIRDGAEVGEVSEVAEVGTAARVEDFQQLPDGLLGITCRGERRFRIVGRDLQKDGLHLADVEWLDDAPGTLTDDEFRGLRDLLARALEELEEAYACGPPRMDDALWVSGQLGQLLPFAAAQRQQCLELPDARQRLQWLQQAITRTG